MKIYGMHGLLEWHGHVHANGVSMKVDFTNGSTTAYGVAPATFITKNKMTQFLMENSKEFKSGRIRLIRSVPLPDEPDDDIVAVPEPTPSAEVAGSGMPDSGEGATGPADSEDSKAEEGFVSNSFAPIKVATKSDAIEWLKEHHPEKEYTAVKLRSKAAFDAACEECGVVFEIAE